MKKLHLKVNKAFHFVYFLFTILFVFFRLVTNPFKAKYSSSRLEKVVRDCFFQENHFLPFRNRATKCRSNTNSWSKVSLLTKYLQLIFINCFAYVCLQQSIPCAVSYPRWCHSRRSQRYPKNIPGKQFIFVYFFTYLFAFDYTFYRSLQFAYFLQIWLQLFTFSYFVRWWRRVS